MRVRFALVLLLSAATAGAATRTWTGAVSGLWSNPGNWAEGAVPASGDALVFPPNNSQFQCFNDLPDSQNTPFHSVSVTASYLTISGPSGSGLVLTNGFDAGTAAYDFSFGIPVRLAAPQTWRCHAGRRCGAAVTTDGHTLTLESGPGYFSIAPKGSGTIVNTAGSLDLSLYTAGYTGDVIANGGKVQVWGSANPSVDVVTNGAVLDIQQTVLRSVHTTGGSARASRAEYEYPIATIGQVSFGGNARLELTLSSVSTTVFEIRGSESEGTDGTITLDGVTLVVAAPAEPGRHFLPPGQEIQLFDNDSDEPVNGTFAGLPEGATFRSQNGQRFRISYTAHDGNDVVVTALAQYDAPFDLDGDGKADLFWRNTSTGLNYRWLMDGYWPSSIEMLNEVDDDGWQVVAIADFDADGDSDVFWRHAVTGQNYVYLMQDGAIAQAGVLNEAGTGWYVAGTGDLNGDGKADVLWRNSVMDEGYLYLMNGLQIAGAGPLRPVSSQWTLAGTGDVDLDGNADVIWQHDGGDIYVWRMNGLTIASEGRLASVDPTSRIVGVGRLNAADGNADLLLRDEVTGAVRVYLLRNDTVWWSYLLSIISDPQWQIEAVGDFNGDAVADIVWRHASGQNYMHILTGTPGGGQYYGYEMPPVTGTGWEIEP